MVVSDERFRPWHTLGVQPPEEEDALGYNPSAREEPDLGKID